jgi:CubicO group peptidase (beta-lactamase class C family)
MKARVLSPLGMQHSSYRWQDAFEENYAGGHDKNGKAKKARRFYMQSNAAFSLYTTPTDYARFLIEIMRSDRSADHSLKADSVKSMTTLQVEPEPDTPRSRRSLGWIIDAAEDGGYVRHTGTNGAGFHCVARFCPDRKSGCVIMTNNVGARAACEQILKIIDAAVSGI